MANYRQFNPVPLVCPNCGHVIGQQAYFESFESKVAVWLNGQVAPSATPGFDVWKCEPFPDLTFQVKYATAYTNQSSYRSVPDVSWSWIAKNQHPTEPNYFVLFGIHTDGAEYVFLYSREDFYQTAWNSYKGNYHIRASAKLKSDRKNYNYVPKIWKHHIPNPNTALVSAIDNYPHQLTIPA